MAQALNRDIRMDRTSGEVPDDRCGYAHNLSTIPDLGTASCWRPVWEDADRCIWHANKGKPKSELEEHAAGGVGRVDGAILADVVLDDVDWFEDATLVGADLTETDIKDASFIDADLRESKFNHVDARTADFRGANLQDASFRVCDFRGTYFGGAYFDQAVFDDVRISQETTFGGDTVYERELGQVEEEDTEWYNKKAQAAVWTYREIQNLYEDNALPLESRRYYLKEKNMRRRVAWHLGNYGRALRAEASRWVTGYGMSHYRVLGSMAVLIAVSAVLYPLTGGLHESVTGEQSSITWVINEPTEAPANYMMFVLFRSLYFSVITFTTLGYGDIRPVGGIARAIAAVEAILGSLLMALLVFVLSRRIS